VTDHMVIGFLSILAQPQLKFESSTTSYGHVYSIQPYVINLFSGLRKCSVSPGR